MESTLTGSPSLLPSWEGISSVRWCLKQQCCLPLSVPTTAASPPPAVDVGDPPPPLALAAAMAAAAFLGDELSLLPNRSRASAAGVCSRPLTAAAAVGLPPLVVLREAAPTGPSGTAATQHCCRLSML